MRAELSALLQAARRDTEPRGFWTTEDLPLFSGAAQRAPSSEAPAPAGDGVQVRLPVSCGLCRDTGIVDGRRCWCPVGQRKPANDGRWHSASTMWPDVEPDEKGA